MQQTRQPRLAPLLVYLLHQLVGVACSRTAIGLGLLLGCLTLHAPLHCRDRWFENVHTGGDAPGQADAASLKHYRQLVVATRPVRAAGNRVEGWWASFSWKP